MRILVPVDDSKYSIEALKIAADYARTKGAEVCLITVVPYVEAVDLDGVGERLVPGLGVAQHRQAGQVDIVDG